MKLRHLKDSELLFLSTIEEDKYSDNTEDIFSTVKQLALELIEARAKIKELKPVNAAAYLETLLCFSCDKRPQKYITGLCEECHSSIPED